MDDKKSLDKLNQSLGRAFGSMAAKFGEDAARRREFVTRYPERIVYPSGMRSGKPRFGVTWKGDLTAYQLNSQQSANHQKPYFVNLHDPREMLAEDAEAMNALDAEIKKLNDKRQRLLKKAHGRAKLVPVEWAIEMTKERNAWKKGGR